MNALLAFFLLLPTAASAAERTGEALKKGVEALNADRKEGRGEEASLNGLFGEKNPSAVLEEPRPAKRPAAPPPRAAAPAAAPLAQDEAKPAPIMGEPPPVPFDPHSTLYQSEKDKMSVLAALGYLKIGVMQGGAVAIYGFESLGQVTSHGGGPKDELLSVMNSAVAQGVLAAVSAAADAGEGRRWADPRKGPPLPH